MVCVITKIDHVIMLILFFLWCRDCSLVLNICRCVVRPSVGWVPGAGSFFGVGSGFDGSAMCGAAVLPRSS